MLVSILYFVGTTASFSLWKGEAAWIQQKGRCASGGGPTVVLSTLTGARCRALSRTVVVDVPIALLSHTHLPSSTFHKPTSLVHRTLLKTTLLNTTHQPQRAVSERFHHSSTSHNANGHRAQTTARTSRAAVHSATCSAAASALHFGVSPSPYFLGHKQRWCAGDGRSWNTLVVSCLDVPSNVRARIFILNGLCARWQLQRTGLSEVPHAEHPKLTQRMFDTKNTSLNSLMRWGLYSSSCGRCDLIIHAVFYSGGWSLRYKMTERDIANILTSLAWEARKFRTACSDMEWS